MKHITLFWMCSEYGENEIFRCNYCGYVFEKWEMHYKNYTEHRGECRGTQAYEKVTVSACPRCLKEDYSEVEDGGDVESE